MAFSPEGEFLVSGGADRIIRVWDITSHEECCSSERLQYSARDLAVTPRAEIIAAAVASRTRTRETLDDVFGVVLPRDENRCDSAWLWDRLRGAPREIMRTTDFREMQLHPSNTSVAFGWQTETRLQDLEDGECICELRHDVDTTFAFMPDGRWITAEFAEDPKDAGGEAVRLRDASSGEVIGNDIGHHDSFVTVLAAAPDGQRVASADRDGTIRIWSVESAESVAAFRQPDVRVRQLIFLPDGERLVSVGDDLTIRLWNSSSEDAVSTWEPPRANEAARSTCGTWRSASG